MKLLLDTHVLVWSMTDPDRLRATDHAIIRDRANTILFSTASIWEVAIKFSLRRPDFTVDPFVLTASARRQFNEIRVEASAAARVATLPNHHRDPFDRLLVAQAMEEDARLLTMDGALAAYSPHVLLTAPAGARVSRP